MTMPDERMRSLRWGWELLDAIQRDASLPADMVQRAAELQLIYPSPELLAALVESTPPEISTTAASSIDDARELFERLQYGDQGSAETRKHTMFTLRHFPRTGKFLLAGNMPGLASMETWLAAAD